MGVFFVICLKFAIKRLYLTLYGPNQAYFGLFLTVLGILLQPLLYFNLLGAGEENQVMR